MKETLTTIEKALFLKELDVFEQVSVEHLVELAVLTEEVHFDPGVDIIREGEPAEHSHIIVEGNVVIERGGIITSALNAGAGFGDLSFVPGTGYGYTVRSVDHTHVLRMAVDDAREVMLEHPEIAIGVMRRLAMRIRELEERLAEFSRRYLDEPPPSPPTSTSPDAPASAPPSPPSSPAPDADGA